MLEAPALLVQRVSELIVTSVAAFIATEPGAYSSSRLPPGVLPTISCRGFWRRSRADKRCRSAGAICESRDHVVPKAADPPWDRVPTRIASSQTRPAAAFFTPRQDQPPPSMWPQSQRRRRSPSSCSGRLAGAGIPVSHMSLGCTERSASQGVATPASHLMAVRAKALPLRRRISWQCEPWRCHAGAASRHGSRTTPARTHPCSTHLHRHRTHHALTSPPATRRLHPLQRPRPS